MTTIEAKIPDFLARQALAAAEREKIPVDQIIALALSAQLAAWHGSEDMAARSKRAKLDEFAHILADAPKVSPIPGDELPEGYQRAQRKAGNS
jgi:hypothetical protein